MQNFEGLFKPRLSYWRPPLIKILERLNYIWGNKDPKRGYVMDSEAILKTLKIFNFTTIDVILMKTATNMYGVASTLG